MKSKETPQTKATRLYVVLSIVLSVLTLGLPLFLYTTSIHRAQLPTSEIEARVASFDHLKIELPIHLNFSAEHVVDETQREVDRLLARDGVQGWGLRIVAGNANPTAEYVVNFKHDPAEEVAFSYNVEPHKVITVNLNLPLGEADLPKDLASTLVDGFFYEEIAAVKSIKSGAKDADVVFPYSKKYHLVYNLLVEGGKPVTWEVEKALESMSPVFAALGHYCKLKVSTQIQYYSKLRTEPHYDAEKRANVIPLNDLSTFINYGEWNLNNHDITPSINFILYFADGNYNGVPLLVENSKTNSFLIPQWGGVLIYNTKMPALEGATINISEQELKPVFETFASQLFELLGMPKAPPSPYMRMDSFHRITTLKNLKRSLETLTALVKLSSSLNGISIPESTKIHVEEALASYDAAIKSLGSTGGYSRAVEQAADCAESSDKAFFEKEMVQQAYFPSEHKLAVYLPLLGPICSIVFFGAIKLFKLWREEKKAAKGASKEKKEI